MLIIAQNVQIVNQTTEKSQPTKQKRDELMAKWANHKEMAERVSKKMFKIGEFRRGERMSNCANFITYNYCHDCDTYTIQRTNLCRDRFCPTCNWRLSLKRYVDMTRILDVLSQEHGNRNYSFITLTVENCRPEELNQTMKDMYYAWNRMLQRKVIKDDYAGALGWAKSIEVTYNPYKHTMHPHYHVLIAWQKQQRGEELLNAWLKSCEKQGLTVTHKAQNQQSIKAQAGEEGESMANAILETFKYSFKSKQLDEMPYREFKILVDEIGGKRLVSFGGVIKEIAARLKIDMENLGDETMYVCKKCGSVDVDQLIYKWAFGTYECVTIKTPGEPAEEE